MNQTCSSSSTTAAAVPLFDVEVPDERLAMLTTDLEAERTILGYMLREPDGTARIEALGIVSQHFHHAPHGILHHSAVMLRKAGNLVNIWSLSVQMRVAFPSLNECGGLEGLCDFWSPPKGSTLEECVLRVKTMHARLVLFRSARQLIRHALTDQDVDTLTELNEAALQLVRRDIPKTRRKTRRKTRSRSACSENR